jgi:hypothetical protein
MAESLLSTVLPSNSIRPEIPRSEISTVFVENSNNKATLEDVYYNNNIVLSGQNAAYNSTNSFKLTKSYHFIKNLVLKIELTFDGTNPQFYNDYVGHSMIENIKYQIDSTELLTQNGYAMVDILNEQCENQDQKNKFLEMSGYKELGNGLANTSKAYLYVPLELPCSSCRPGSFHAAKSFPLYLVPGHIELLISTRPESQVCAATGHATISNIQLLVNYGKIGNFSQMSKMIRFPSRQYANTQRILVGTTAGATNDGASVLTFSLSSFRRAELTNILLRWCPARVSANFNNFLEGSEISSLNVLFNGVQIWSNAAMSDPIWDVLSGEKPSYQGFKRQFIKILATAGTQVTGNFVSAGTQYLYNDVATNKLNTVYQNVITTANGGGGTNVFDWSFYGNNSSLNGSPTNLSGQLGQEQRYYNINLSEIRLSQMNNNEYALGYDLSKQTLNLEMILPKTNVAGTYSSFGGYLYFTYVYNSVYQLEEDQSSVLAF